MLFYLILIVQERCIYQWLCRLFWPWHDIVLLTLQPLIKSQWRNLMLGFLKNVPMSKFCCQYFRHFLMIFQHVSFSWFCVCVLHLWSWSHYYETRTCTKWMLFNTVQKILKLLKFQSSDFGLWKLKREILCMNLQILKILI